MTLPMQLTDTFTTSKDVVTREVGGEMVLLDLESGQYFGLDPVGGTIWEALDERPHTLAELCDVIEAAFDAPRAQIETDMLALAAQLQDQGLIAAHAA